MSIMPVIEVPAPEVAPRRFGLLSVADIASVSLIRSLGGTEFRSNGCVPTHGVAGELCAVPSGTSEVQTISVTGTPTGGTYTLTFAGQTTSAIAYNATAPTVQAALEALANLSPGDLTVTGTYPNFTVNFQPGGQYGATDAPQITATSSLTGGTAPNVTTSTTTQGIRTPKVITEDSEWTNGFSFTTFVHRECRAVGDFTESKARTVEMFNIGEQNAIETALWGHLVSRPDVTILHGGTALAVDDAIAALEGYAGRVYAGDPVLHAPRGLVSLATDNGPVERHGNRLETVMGASVAAGGGYGHNGPGAAVADGVSWMFATGKVFGEQGVLNVSDPHFVQSPRDNSARVIAERSYSMNVDCFVAAVLVTNDGFAIADGS